MARLLIFDTAASVDAAGVPILQDITVPILATANYDIYYRSKPVRLFGAPDADTRNISYEFVATGGYGTVTATGVAVSTYDLYWFQEFLNDQANPRSLPTQRSTVGFNVNWPWAREVSSEMQGSGSVFHYQVVRKMTVTTGNTPGVTVDQASCWYFPMIVHGLWVRLGLRTTETTSTTTWGEKPRVRVYAHVGGYDNLTTLEAMTAPYVLS